MRCSIRRSDLLASRRIAVRDNRNPEDTVPSPGDVSDHGIVYTLEHGTRCQTELGSDSVAVRIGDADGFFRGH